MVFVVRRLADGWLISNINWISHKVSGPQFAAIECKCLIKKSCKYFTSLVERTLNSRWIISSSCCELDMGTFSIVAVVEHISQSEIDFIFFQRFCRIWLWILTGCLWGTIFPTFSPSLIRYIGLKLEFSIPVWQCNLHLPWPRLQACSALLSLLVLAKTKHKGHQKTFSLCFQYSFLCQAGKQTACWKCTLALLPLLVYVASKPFLVLVLMVGHFWIDWFCHLWPRSRSVHILLGSCSNIAKPSWATTSVPRSRQAGASCWTLDKFTWICHIRSSWSPP